MEIVSENKSHGGRQLVVKHGLRHRPPNDVLDIPSAQAEGAKLPIVWYLSGLTCTHANVTEKGEYRAACAEHGLIFVAPDTSPRGQDVPGADDEAMISVRAQASMSMRPRALARTLSHGTYVADELPALIAVNFRSTWNDRESPAIRWVAMAR